MINAVALFDKLNIIDDLFFRWIGFGDAWIECEKVSQQESTDVVKIVSFVVII